MVNVGPIARRELISYFYSPIAYVVMTLFLLVEGYSFYLFVRFLNQPDAPHGAVLQYFFGGTFLYWMFLIFVVATITMRLLAEERRSGTIETLMTAPVSDAEVVLGKYLAALIFYVLLWAPTLAYVALLWKFAPRGAGPELGPVAAGYLGTLLIGASWIAVGVLASALTRNQIVAAIVTFAALSLLLLAGVMEVFVQAPWAKAAIDHLNLFEHMDTFAKGIVDTRPIVFHLTVAALALFSAVRVLGAKKGF